MYLKESQFEHHFHDHHQSHNGHGSFILPFTIGGFLYIALVGIIPEILKETNLKISLSQIFSFMLGIAFIFALTQFENILASQFL